jgi:uncharacterized protein YbjQ (UPF0145 family)
MPFRWLPLVALVALSGCGVGKYAHEPENDYATYDSYTPALATLPAPAQESRVRFLEGPIAVPTQVLGLVEVEGCGTPPNKVFDLLEAKAAALGADAIVGLDYKRDPVSCARWSATAIRFKDLVQGREYETLGNIEVAYIKGEEAAALKKLKAKAKAMHADLLLDLKYEREGADARVSGTAIRFVR